MKKFFKKIGIGVLIILGVIILFTIGLFVFHKIKSNSELELLKKQGYYNLVSVGDYSLNVSVFGNYEGKHRIIGLAGLGSGDFSVAMRQMTKSLEEDNLVAFVDRAGYGFSDDTDNDMTVEYIVEDYRKALKNAGIEAPYILMPHSIGGAYATYWVSKYPEEIEAVVFVDGSELCEDAFADEPVENVGLSDRLLATMAKLGFSRLVLRNYFYHYPDNYSEKEQQLADALMFRTLDSIAPVSEACLLADNAQYSFKEIIQNDVPKLYICSSWGIEDKETFLEYCSWTKRQKEINHLEIEESSEPLDDNTINGILEKFEKGRKETIFPYVDKLGNCEFVCLGGDHMIYEQKPKECGDIVNSFIKGLD